MKRAFLAILVLMMAGPVWAKSKDFERLYLQMSVMQREIADVKRNSDDTLKELRRLNEILAQQSESVKSSVHDQNLQTEALKVTLKEVSDALSALQQRLGVSATPPSGSSPESVLSSGGSDPIDVDTPSPAELYSQAYADYARGNYDLAIQAFQEYLRLNPSTHLSDNAQYWIGECLFGKRAYSEAVAAWDDLLRQFPGTDKIPDARYKKAIALEKMGRSSQAMIEYRYVSDHFPNTDAGRKARQRTAR
ncbi:MAG: tol-pal system protein YbgF [Vicinamibacteria bacterium]|nr:tol-pal system protein YbgF [Vicinamibacteria bacterium]